jgi:hypothetical protein
MSKGFVQFFITHFPLQNSLPCCSELQQYLNAENFFLQVSFNAVERFHTAVVQFLMATWNKIEKKI